MSFHIYSSLVVVLIISVISNVMSYHFLTSSNPWFQCFHSPNWSGSSIANPVVDSSFRSVPSFYAFPGHVISFPKGIGTKLRDERFSVSSSNLLVDFRASLWRMSPASHCRDLSRPTELWNRNCLANRYTNRRLSKWAYRRFADLSAICTNEVEKTSETRKQTETTATCEP